MQLRAYMEEQRIKDAWRTQERVVVCVKPSVKATRLIRRGYQMTRRQGGVFWTVFVRTPGAMLPPKEEELLQELHALTRNLGGEMVELEDDAITEAIVRFTREHQATSIVLGQSVRSRLEEILRGSIITRIMRETRHLDVVVVADAEG